ncbi:hypothetical protein LSCM1_07194 [Leishmania martiniquensis]|uniref:Uncharacterized protein n=1 Tax=Leishmania martiniquensis TaxID=1580590 RepID=A0A836KU55_9TRYP|nr:hypothetical protein LSCM1_07194 [Leishmania martiniquensis]
MLRLSAAPLAPLQASSTLLFFSWLSRSSELRGTATATRRTKAKDTFMSEAAMGLGGNDMGQPMANEAFEALEGTGTSTASYRQAGIHGIGGRGVGDSPTLPAGGSGAPGSTVPKQPIDDILIERAAHLNGPNRRPVSYDLEIHRAARAREEAQRHIAQEHRRHFDEQNMPLNPDDPRRERASWEFAPTPEHKSLVLLLYRHVLKGLVHYKSVRRRSMIAYARMCFRRRAMATEKLLIDECIEECRRSIYVLGKHHHFTKTGTYEFDSMALPKDTGQDVKTYMEEVYDPEQSRMQFQNFTDVQPGREHLHRQGLGPTSGPHHWRDQRSSEGFRVEIRDEDKALRPPPPPGMAS